VVEAIQDVQRRLSDLQEQIDGLATAIGLERAPDESAPPADGRLAQVVDRHSEILSQLAAACGRQARAVEDLEARLAGLYEIEDRLQRDAAYRVQDLGRTLSREWDSRRRLHDEPLNQLRDQVLALTEASAAVGRAERESGHRAADLVSLESELHRRMTDLRTRVEAAIAELKSLGAPRVPPDTVAGRLGFPISSRPDVDGPGAMVPPDTVALRARLETLEQTVARARDTREVADRRDRVFRVGRAAVALLAVGAIALVVLAMRLQRQVGVAPVREEPTADVVAATEAPVMARTMSEILAAPDLIRYPLSAEETNGRGTGLLLLSRSRGIVFTAARLAPPPEDSIYQVWLLTPSSATSVGTFRPDASGRVTLATGELPSVPQPVVSVSVTVEPGSGSDQPSRTVVLARAPQ
jgi:anti-sigma-K factor RskA